MKKPEVLNLIKENVGFSNEQTNELYDDVYDIIEYYYYEDDGYYISFTEESIESTLSEREEYKKLVDEEAFDVIFLDHRMPVIKGANLAADIRNSDGPNQNTIIVFISGNIKEVKTLAESLPLCYFLQKPLILQELYDLLDSF